MKSNPKEDKQDQGLTKPTTPLSDTPTKPNEQSMEGSVEGVDKTTGLSSKGLFSGGLTKPTGSLHSGNPPKPAEQPMEGSKEGVDKDKGPERPKSP